MIRFAAAVSTVADSPRAIAEVCDRACSQLGEPADLALVFVTHHHADAFPTLAQEVGRASRAANVLGCTAEAVVAGRREIESQPAIALWLARLHGARVVPMHLEFEQTAEGGTIVGWPDKLSSNWPQGSTLLVLADPFSFPADVLLARLGEDQPGVLIAGGMASGGWQPRQNRLFLNGTELHDGAVAVLVHGEFRVRSVVSQGCRPIGRHFVVTKAQQNVILELSGKPALAQLQAVFDELSTEDQMLVRQGLHVGRVVNEYQDEFRRGDFLVRNCIGSDPDSGAIAIGDYVRTGQTVQFHVRDAATANEDLRELVSAARRESPSEPRGALLFTCNGRGMRLFGLPDHDASVLCDLMGNIPLAGFFAQGEIGPIGGRSFVHGFTASVVLFEGDE